MSVLKLYKASDDSLVSEAPSTSNPVGFTLRADLNEQDAMRLYAKCDTGYQATGVTVVGAGATVAKWEIAPDNAGNPGAYQAANSALNLGTVTTAPVYFWARASAADTEEIGNDVSVTLTIEGVGAAV